jgi:hypothetical protein
MASFAGLAVADDVFGSHPVFSTEDRTIQRVINHIAANLDPHAPVAQAAAKGDKAINQDGGSFRQGSRHRVQLRGSE